MKNKKILTIVMGIAFIVVCMLIVVFTCMFIEALNNHRCYNLPLNEFYQDNKCKKYWDMKRWSDK